MNYSFAIQHAKVFVTHLTNNDLTEGRYPCPSQHWCRCFTLEAIAQVFELVYLKLNAGKNAFLLQDQVTEMVTVCQNWMYNHHNANLNYSTVV